MNTWNRNFCRTCLEENESLESIFKVDEDSDISTLAEMISTSISSSVHITQNDGYSDRICATCSQKVLEFHKFKLSIEKNELFLKSGIRNDITSENIFKNKPLIERNLDLDEIKNESDWFVKQELLHQEENIIEQHEDVEYKFPTSESDKDEVMWQENNSNHCLSSLLKQEDLHQNLIIEQQEQKEEGIPFFETCFIKNEVLQQDNISEDGLDEKTCSENDDQQDIYHQEEMEFQSTQSDSDESSSYENQLEEETDTNSFDCKQCNRKFVRKHDLKRHLLIHSGIKKFQCGKCNKKFATRRNLNRHILIHTSEKQFECEYCDKKFHLRRNLQYHSIVHSDKKEFECEQCHKKFMRKSHMQRHLLTHSGEKAFECEQCNKRFTCKLYLANHLLIHKDKAEKNFECEECNQKFATKRNLNRHTLIHTGEKQFECEYCFTKFRHKSSLTNHLMIHTGEKPFECEYCQKKFTLKWNLQGHLLLHMRKKKC